MTQLHAACFEILTQLENTVEQLKPDDFIKPSQALSNATLGQHLRHTLEFFLCLEKGFEAGTINYDKREHDKLVESDKFLAQATIGRIREFVQQQKSDKSLTLEVGYERHTENTTTVSTNYFRELTYNIEHAIHHMAIMKIGVREVAPYVKLADHFGVAVSTVRYQEAVVEPVKG
jgi:uncharacterized damage-inducible protein DinB